MARNRNNGVHLYFDCDPGCDDALAIAQVIRHQASLQKYDRVNIMVVAGNASVDQSTSNAARVVTSGLLDANQSGSAQRNPEILKEAIHIFRGCSRSMSGESPSAASVHGRDGLGDVPNCLIWGRSGLSTEESDKAQSLAQKILENVICRDRTAIEQYLSILSDPESIIPFDLLCTGPLTNLASALNLMSKRQEDVFWENCRSAIVMGGAFGLSGNVTHSAEFNTFADPAATQTVLNSYSRFRREKDKQTNKLHFVSLDITEMLAIPLDQKQDQGITTHTATFLMYALKQYGQFHVFHCKRPKVSGDSGKVLYLGEFNPEAYINAQMAGGNGDSELKRFCYLHDPLAAWVLLEGLTRINRIWREVEIRIETARDQGRGRIILCEQKAARESTPVRLGSHGSKVRWLDPSKFGASQKQKFVSSVAELLGIELSWRADMNSG